MSGGLGGVVSALQQFAEAVVAAGASILNDLMTTLGGEGAKDKVVDEFSTQNDYLYQDEHIESLYNRMEPIFRSLLRGTTIADELRRQYHSAYMRTNVRVPRALSIVNGTHDDHEVAYSPMKPIGSTNFTVPSSMSLDILPSAVLRVNNLNLFEGDESTECASHNSNYANFFWHTKLDANGDFTKAANLDSTTFVKVQNSTTEYLKYLGVTDPGTYLNDIDYASSIGNGDNLRDAIDSAFINFRVKFVSGLGTDAGNVVSNKYLYKFADGLSNQGVGGTAGNAAGIATALNTYVDSDGNTQTKLYKYVYNGDASEYTVALSHISYSTHSGTTHTDYAYDKDKISPDGYYYYDAVKTWPTASFTANTVAGISGYLNSTSVATTSNSNTGGAAETSANWLEIQKNTIQVLVGTNTYEVFPDEISLVGTGITLTTYSHMVPGVNPHHIWTQAGVNAGMFGATHAGAVVTIDLSGVNNSYYTHVPYAPPYHVWVDAKDQVLKIDTLYKKKNTTEIMFAVIPPSVYQNSKITYGRANRAGVSFYTIHNVNSMERIHDFAYSSEFHYVTTSLNGTSNSVALPILLGIWEELTVFEKQQLVLASVNVSVHTAYYLRIEKTWEQKARAATLGAIKLAAIVFAVYTAGSSLGAVAGAQSIAIAAELAAAEALKGLVISIAAKEFLTKILVPTIIRNFGEDEELIVLAIVAVAAAVATAYYGDTLNLQFADQTALFANSMDIINQSSTIYYSSKLENLYEDREKENWGDKSDTLAEKIQKLKDLIATETDDSSLLLDLQKQTLLNPMEPSGYFAYHNNKLESQFNCYEYDQFTELNTSSTV